MSETLFIADLHLHPAHPATLEMCLQFLQGRATQAEALYILGDLFEAWPGDDDDTPVYRQVIAALHQLRDEGTQIFIMHGNRDFLLGDAFATASGTHLLKQDACVIDLYERPTLLMHGDVLCTRDEAYQAFRHQVRNPAWQQQFLAHSLADRRLLAQQARQASQKHTQQSAEEIMDVTLSAVETVMQSHHVHHLIHGHTHRPAKHSFQLNDQPACRWVVGDWHDDTVPVIRSTPDGNELLPLNQL